MTLVFPTLPKTVRAHSHKLALPHITWILHKTRNVIWRLESDHYSLMLHATQLLWNSCLSVINVAWDEFMWSFTNCTVHAASVLWALEQVLACLFCRRWSSQTLSYVSFNGMKMSLLASQPGSQWSSTKAGLYDNRKRPRHLTSQLLPMEQWSQSHSSLSDSLITDPRPRSNTVWLLVG